MCQYVSMELRQCTPSEKGVENRVENDYLESLPPEGLVVDSKEPLVSVEYLERFFMTIAQSDDHERILRCFSNLVNLCA